MADPVVITETSIPTLDDAQHTVTRKMRVFSQAQY
jgi:hypothetical protein